MFFSYSISVILLSLSMYGIWCALHDIWKWWLALPLGAMPTGSFLVVVRNLDGETEELLRFLGKEIEEKGMDWDLVVVVTGLNELPFGFVERLLGDGDRVQVMLSPTGHQVIDEAIGLCQGKVVHILDLCHRISHEEFMAAVCALLGQERQEVAVRRMLE